MNNTVIFAGDIETGMLYWVDIKIVNIQLTFNRIFMDIIISTYINMYIYTKIRLKVDGSRGMVSVWGQRKEVVERGSGWM